MWTQLVSLMRKELRQTLRDRRMVQLLVVAPFVQLIVLGYAVDFEVDRVPTVVVDQDGSAHSRAHLRRLLADGTLRAVEQTTDPARAVAEIVDGRASIAIVVPDGFARDLVRGRPARVQVLLDGTDPNRAGVASGAIQRYFAAAAAGPAGPRLRVESRVLYNPGLDTATFIVPGVAAILLLVVTSVLASMGLARERQTGTLEQILVSPVRPWVVMAGKVLPFFGFGLLDFLLALAAGAYLFDVPLRGGFALLLGATLLYLMSTLGVGLLVAAVSRSQQQAFLGAFLFMLPMILLSGIMTPVRSMPAWLQHLTLLNPVRHYAQILRADLLEGAGLAELWPQVAALAAIGGGLLAVALLRFQKTLE